MQKALQILSQCCDRGHSGIENMCVSETEMYIIVMIILLKRVALISCLSTRYQ
jgi:hypothetical protein